MSVTSTLAPFRNKSADGYTAYTSVDEAYEELCRLYDAETKRIQDAFEAFRGEKDFDGLNGLTIKGYYPSLKIQVDQDNLNLNPTFSHGVFKEEGTYFINVADPRKYHDLLGQMKQLADNSGDIEFQVGLSNEEIPLHYAMQDLSFDLDTAVKQGGRSAELSAEKSRLARRVFTERKPLDNLDYAAKKHRPPEGLKPLFGYGPSRFDHAVTQFFYYTRTPWEALQPFVIFSNYEQYVKGVYNYGQEQLGKTFNAAANRAEHESDVIAVIRSGHDVIIRNGFEDNEHLITIQNAVSMGTKKGAQMASCHVITQDGLGFSMINTGVGDANCKNIANLIAPKRSHAWMMAGHCAGLDPTMQIGDYVSADAYFTNLVDNNMVNLPYAPSSEMQSALITVLKRLETRDESFNRHANHRRCPVVSTNDRNWENSPAFMDSLTETNAGALEMEAAFLAKEARLHAIPVASFLKVSDMPHFDRPKTPSATDEFFGSVGQHLGIILEACEEAKASHLDKLHSRRARPVRGAFVFQ